MNVPKYKPELWVLFYRRNLVGMGRIVGAHIPNYEDSEEWQYTVDKGGSMSGEWYDDVSENDIFCVLRGDRWERVETMNL